MPPFRKLARLRKATPALRQGALVDLLVDDDTYAFARVAAGSHAIVAFTGAPSPGTRIPACLVRLNELLSGR